MKLPFTKDYEAYTASWERLAPRIKAGIEEHRRDDAVLLIRDELERPVEGAVAEIRQRTHAFKFGCNALLLGQLGELNTLYEEKIVKLMNLVTTTFCWNALEPIPGKLRFEEGSEEIFRRPPPDRIVKFGRKYGIALKGQPLLCDNWIPSWAPQDPDEVRRLYIGFFEKVAARYGRDFHIWDVVNEAFSCARRRPDFQLYTPDLGYVEWAFREARRIFPEDGGLLEINEGSSINCGAPADRYYALVKGLKERNSGVQAVGFQFHITRAEAAAEHIAGRLFPLEEIYNNYLRFSKLGLPMFITEITVPSRFDCDMETGRQLQAEIVRNLYRLWFSIPSMAGIIYWNFKDGQAWKTEGDCLGCLTDENLNEKPAYTALYDLIHGEWKTNLTLRSDGAGRITFRGFYGEYDITVRTADRTLRTTLSIEKGGKNTTEVIL